MPWWDKPLTKAVKPTLSQVFEKGVGSYSKEELEASIKDAMVKVFRYDRHAPELMKEGFRKDLLANPPLIGDDLEQYLLQRTKMPPEDLHNMIRTGKYTSEVADIINDWSKYKSTSPFDEKGLYWGWGETPNPESLPPYQSSSPEHLVTGALNPKAIPGIDFKTRAGSEVIQKEPNQVLAKYGDLFKIIGLGGGTTLGSQLIPDNEAQAEPISGRIGKTMVKELGEVVGKSSAAQKLIGKEVDGKIVKDVVKGVSDWRYILFEDGSRLPVRKNVMADMMKEVGTQTYMDKLKTQETESSKLMQAYKSLQFHIQRQQPLVDKAAKEEWRQNYSKYMDEVKLKEVPWTYVESHNVYLPEEYAKILEDANVVQIKKGK